MKDYIFDDTAYDHPNQEYLLYDNTIFDFDELAQGEQEISNNIFDNNLVIAIEQNKKDNLNQETRPIDILSSVAIKNFCANQNHEYTTNAKEIYQPHYTCKYDTCHQTFNHISYLNQHIATNHPNKIFAIEKYQYKSSERLNNNNDDEQYITIDNFNKIFSIELDKDSYIKSDDTLSLITTKDYYSNPEPSCTLRSGKIYEPQYTCKYHSCNETFTHMSYRNQHMKEEHVKKIFTIERCKDKYIF